MVWPCSSIACRSPTAIGSCYAMSASWCRLVASPPWLVLPAQARARCCICLRAFICPTAARYALAADLRDIGSDQVYRVVSMVFQQVQLFDGSIIDNVRAGREQASDEE